MITVVDWIPYEKASELPEAVGGLGGWFDNGHRWADYIDGCSDEAKPYYEAIRKSVIERGLKLGGDEHQESDEGCPLFSDGKSGTFSYRAWGDLMAAIWSEHENKDYSYMDFYMRVLLS